MSLNLPFPAYREPPCFSDVDPFDDGFEREPGLLFEQARSMVCYEVDRGRWLLVFERPLRIVAPQGVAADDGGMCDGCQIVAYECDERGAVITWRHRYEVEAPTMRDALIKMRFMLANDLLNISNYEE